MILVVITLLAAHFEKVPVLVYDLVRALILEVGGRGVV